MLKICDLAIIKPLSIIFRNRVNHSTFPDLGKKSNIYPFHKKGDKQIINDYRPVSLLPICEKIFQRLIFDTLFEYLENTNYYQLINLVFEPMILVLINCCLLSITFMQPLRHIQLLNLVEFSWICLRPLIKYDTTGSF